MYGFNNISKLEGYWSPRGLSPLVFFDIISQDHFSVFLKLIHLYDCWKSFPRVHLAMILQHLLESLLRKFRSNFIPWKELSIDKHLVSYKERLSFLQYIPKKSTQWAMKSVVLATGTVVIYITGSYIQVRISHVTCIYYCKSLKRWIIETCEKFSKMPVSQQKQHTIHIYDNRLYWWGILRISNHFWFGG